MDDPMQHRVFVPCRLGWILAQRTFLSLFFVVVIGVGLSGERSAAVEPARLASSQLIEIGDLLRQGRTLEVEDRWDEALSHYEKAIRSFPNELSLKRRFEFSRMHFDVRRRLADQSYCRSLEQLSLDKALSVYEEVLVRIQTHHVDAPLWRELVEQGTNNFDVALSEPAFVEHNLHRCSRERIDNFRREMRRELEQRAIRTREDVRAAVEWVALAAQRDLGISPIAVVLEFNCGATNSLDAYSAFLTPDQLNEVYSQIEGNFVGLGVELRTEDGRLTIVRVIPRSPAEYAGLRAGDYILSIDGRDVGDLPMEQAANLLQGDAGSLVALSVASPGQPTRTLQAERRRVDVPSVDEVKIVDSLHGIGYLRLACFQKSTPRDLDDALWELHRRGMRGGVIVDLRGNPGGLLIAAVEAVDRFVESGVIVSTRGRDVREGQTYSAQADGTWRVPLIVLIDKDSASAAEIFAGAIRDHQRGTVIGQQSYGKGSVQGIFPLHSHASGIRLTTARFYSPLGRSYCQVGVTPDKVVQTVARPVASAVDPANDLTLATALDFARQAITRPNSTAQSRVR